MKELTVKLNINKMSQLLTIIAIISNADFVLGTATLGLQTSANCGNQAVLTCTSTDCNKGYTFRKNGVIIYKHNGPLGDIDPGRYNGTVTSSSTVKLTITDIQFSDAGAHTCVCGFDVPSAQQIMQYTCKASTSKATITNEKKLSITVDNLYPQPSNVVTSLTSPLPGTYTCGNSTTLSFHYKCTWLSTTSLTDGNHGYTMTVTTGDQTAYVTGSFRIVGPSNRSATISGNQAASATGTTQIRLNCTSGSSNPASNITWYNKSAVISNVVGYKDWTGNNNGVVTSNILTITPTRYMDGDRITCMTDNSYGSDSKYVDLDILYEYTVCSSMGSTVAMSVSATAFITLFLCTVVIVIVFRRFPDCIMRILQNTCLSGNIATDTEINKVQQSQLGMPVVYSTLVAAENSAGLEHLESTSTYESLNQFGSQPVYTSLKKAAEQRNTYENLKKQISPMHLDESDAKGSSQLI